MSYAEFHAQEPWDNCLDHFAASAMRCSKWLQSWELRAILQGILPGHEIVARQHIGHQQPWLDMAGAGQGDDAADAYIATFRDSINANGIKRAESLNETYPTHNPWALHCAVEFDRAFIRRLPVWCPNTVPVVFCAAIGNPDHDEYGNLLDLARECQAAGGAFGYHAYWPAHGGISYINGHPEHPDLLRNLHMRWKVIDQYLLDRGIRVNWYLGECGPIGFKNDDPYNLNPEDGWRHPGVYNGDIDKLIADADDFDWLLYETQAHQEGRLWGAAYFTSNADPDNWPWFRIEGESAYRLATHTAEHPSPPPEPTMIEGIDVSKWQGAIDWAQVAASGVRFAAIRCTVGDYYKDPYFDANWEGARSNGIAVSAYHVVKPSIPVAQQIQWFLGSLGDRRPDFSLVIDCELSDGLGPDEVSAAILGCADAIADAMTDSPLCYTARWFWNGNTIPGTGLGMDLWNADYDDNPDDELPRDWDDWLFWQYSSTGSVPGIVGNCDLDRFNGGEAEWQAYLDSFHLEPPPPEPVYAEILADWLNCRTRPVVNDDTRITSLAGGSVWRLSGVEDGDWWQIVLAQGDKFNSGRILAWIKGVPYARKVRVN